jgi:pimeloyl-ACP methyl ester carboxylesterase
LVNVVSARSTWFIVVVTLALFAVGVALSRRVEPGIRVEAVTLAEDTPALRFLPTGAGPHPVALLAHGVIASKETLFRFGEALAAAGFASFAIDLPGHGESARPFIGDENARAIERVASVLGTVDVFVGHSMGAYAGADTVRNGGLHPRLFVAVGALPDLGEGHPPLLLLAGRFEEAVSADRLGARADARLVLSPWCDHASEPYDPRLVDAAVEAACAAVGKTPPAGPGRWPERLAGMVLGVLAALFLGHRLPDLSPRLARVRGAYDACLCSSPR